jgi:hypothetical protein
MRVFLPIKSITRVLGRRVEKIMMDVDLKNAVRRKYPLIPWFEFFMMTANPWYGEFKSNVNAARLRVSTPMMNRIMGLLFDNAITYLKVTKPAA